MCMYFMYFNFLSSIWTSIWIFSWLPDVYCSYFNLNFNYVYMGVKTFVKALKVTCKPLKSHKFSICLCTTKNQTNRKQYCLTECQRYINHTKKLTLMTKALMNTAGNRSLYLLLTRQPPRIVAALLAKVNCSKSYSQLS